MTKLMGPIMGKGMLWAREKKKEEPLKSSDGPAKSSAEVVNKFVGNDPDDGDEIRGMARVNGLFLEIRTMVRKHQVEEKINKLYQTFFSSQTRPQNSRFQGFKNNYPLGNIFVKCIEIQGI